MGERLTVKALAEQVVAQGEQVAEIHAMLETLGAKAVAADTTAPKAKAKAKAADLRVSAVAKAADLSKDAQVATFNLGVRVAALALSESGGVDGKHRGADTRNRWADLLGVAEYVEGAEADLSALAPKDGTPNSGAFAHVLRIAWKAKA